MSKHTQGPWKWVESQKGSWTVSDLIGDDGEIVIEYLPYEGYQIHPVFDQEKLKANERMLAAGPVLLEALKAMITSYQYEASQENPALLEAKAAIFEATGEHHEE